MKIDEKFVKFKKREEKKEEGEEKFPQKRSEISKSLFVLFSGSYPNNSFHF